MCRVLARSRSCTKVVQKKTETKNEKRRTKSACGPSEAPEEARRRRAADERERGGAPRASNKSTSCDNSACHYADAAAIAAITHVLRIDVDSSKRSRPVVKRWRAVFRRRRDSAVDCARSACGPSGPEAAERARGGWRPRASENDGVVGYAYATPHNERWAYRWRVNTAIYIRRTQRRGPAGRCIRSCSICAHLGYYKAVAGITGPNPASVGCTKPWIRARGIYRDVGYKLGLGATSAGYQARYNAPPRTPLSRARSHTGRTAEGRTR